MLINDNIFYPGKVNYNTFNIDFNNKDSFEKLIRSITNKNSDEILVHFGI